MRVSFVIPCYNEEKRLDVSALANAELDRGDLELVFVDDGSTDRTRAVLEGLCRRAPSRVRLLALPKNGGKAEAVRRGVLDALGRRPDAVGFWDADLATPLSEMQSFVDVLVEHPTVDLVLGSRVKLLGRVIERRAWRHYLGRIFATAAATALDLAVYDTQCGAKLFRVRPGLEGLFAEPFGSRWVFDVELIARHLASYSGSRAEAAASIYELPVRQWIDVGGSKVKATDFARAALDLALIHQRYRRKR